MVNRIRLTVAWLGLTLLAAPADGSQAPADSLFEGAVASQADLAEVEEVLQELDAAQAPPTAAELSELLAAADTGGGSGWWLVRGGWAMDQAADQSVRARYDSSWLQVKGRWRRDREGRLETGGTVRLGGPSLQVAAGQIGIAHGFGLLVGPPGRGRTLTADGGLGSGSDRWVPWTGSPAAQALRGAGLQAHWRRSQTRLLVGSRPEADASGRPTAVLQGSLTQDSWAVAGVLLSDPAEQGASVAGQARQGRLDGSWEAVWREPGEAALPLRSMLAQIGWRPLAAVRWEVLGGWAEAGPRPVMGQKNPVLGDWAGRGVAWRGTWRVVRGLGVRLLVHRGWGRPESPDGTRPQDRLHDLQVAASGPGGWQGTARWRESATGIWAWSERFPWQVPAPAGLDEKRVTSLSLGREWSRGRGQVQWRRLTQLRWRADPDLDGGVTRSLLGVSGVAGLGRHVSLRGSWTFAWGDSVDLVSAVVPYAGYVLPRHWGQWRSEQVLGLEAGRGPWRYRCAASWRRQAVEAGSSTGGVWAAWAEGGLAW